MICGGTGARGFEARHRQEEAVIETWIKASEQRSGLTPHDLTGLKRQENEASALTRSFEGEKTRLAS